MVENGVNGEHNCLTVLWPSNESLLLLTLKKPCEREKIAVVLK